MIRLRIDTRPSAADAVAAEQRIADATQAQPSPEPPECDRCGESYSLQGLEPTKYCHNCAHIAVDELEVTVAALWERAEKAEADARRLREAATWRDAKVDKPTVGVDVWVWCQGELGSRAHDIGTYFADGTWELHPAHEGTVTHWRYTEDPNAALSTPATKEGA